jgi:hypothetical protein
MLGGNDAAAGRAGVASMGGYAVENAIGREGYGNDSGARCNGLRANGAEHSGVFRREAVVAILDKAARLVRVYGGAAADLSGAERIVLSGRYRRALQDRCWGTLPVRVFSHDGGSFSMNA